jgi:hypothetical protein
VADLTAIRTALANQLFAQLGLRTEAQPRDQVSPPMAVIIPREPLVTFGDTMDGAMTVNLQVVMILSDAAPVEKTQRALDAYLGLGAGEAQSIAGAIMADPSLGGTVSWCEPISISSYGGIAYAGQNYFGARVNISIGTI